MALAWLTSKSEHTIYVRIMLPIWLRELIYFILL